MKLRTEEDVKRMLKVNDFRSISKNQIIEFVSSIPDMDYTCAHKCIEQFPNFAKYSATMTEHLRSVCDEILKHDNQAQELNIAGYMLILDGLDRRSRQGSLSQSEYEYIVQKQFEAAREIERVRRTGQEFKAGVLKTVVKYTAGAVGIAGAMLGVKFLKKPWD